MKQDQGLGQSFLIFLPSEDISACTYMSTIDARQFQMPFLGLVINCNFKKKKKKLDYCRELHQQNFLKINKLRYTEVKSKVCVVIVDLYLQVM